jgi:hypothetical protein
MIIKAATTTPATAMSAVHGVDDDTGRVGGCSGVAFTEDLWEAATVTEALSGASMAFWVAIISGISLALECALEFLSLVYS